MRAEKNVSVGGEKYAFMKVVPRFLSNLNTWRQMFCLLHDRPPPRLSEYNGFSTQIPHSEHGTKDVTQR